MKAWWKAILDRPPSKPQLTCAALALALLLGFITMHKSVWLSRPQGDLRVFCCAGWAVRQGGQLLYHVRDDNGWHYHYPPTFAVFMAPLADRPRRDLALSASSALGAASAPGGGLHAACALAASPASLGEVRGPMLPYPATVAIFYIFNLACLGVAMALLAGTLQETDNSDRRWWNHLLPFLICVPAIGTTLVRGQVQLLLLALVVGFLAGLVRGRRFTAGLCLAGAICLKIFPAFLLLVPLLRRDGRCLAGCAAGLAIGLVALPVAVMGPGATARLYVDRLHFVTSVFDAAGSTRPGADEMLDATATHSQSFQMVLHKTLYAGAGETPPLPATWVRLAHWLIAAGLTIAVLWPGRVRDESGLALIRRVALLTLLMILVCPVCHPNYFTLAMPLVAVVLVPRTLPGRTVVLSAFLAAVSLAMLPGLGVLGDLGLPMYAALALGALAWRWDVGPPISPAESCTAGKSELVLG